MPLKCSKCKTEIKRDEAYHHHSKVLCEACCMHTRAPRIRKTHWQYIKSIKTEYLIPAGKKESNSE